MKDFTPEQARFHNQECEEAYMSGYLAGLERAIDVVGGMRPRGISVIIEKGSEFTTPRMYRELGYTRGIDDITTILQAEVNQDNK